MANGRSRQRESAGAWYPANSCSSALLQPLPAPTCQVLHQPQRAQHAPRPQYPNLCRQRLGRAIVVLFAHPKLRAGAVSGKGAVAGSSGREQWQGAVAGGRSNQQRWCVPRLPLAHAALTPNNSQQARAPRPTHLMPPLHLRYQRHLSLQQQRDAQQAQRDAAHIPHKLPIVADPAQGAAVALRQQPRLDQPAARGRRGVWGADRPLACRPQRACSAQMPTP